MSEADNRASENLLLLCLFHSTVIDSEPSEYSVGTLRAWKETAEDSSSVAPLTDDEVERILTLSIRQEFNLTAEVIKLGGENGGGGGAIGFGAVGGAGGAKYVLDLNNGDLIRSDVAQHGGRDVPASPDGTTIGSASSEGFDGQPGGTTAISTDEQVLIAAGGGGGGLTGAGNRARSGLLRVSALMLANYVETYQGGLCSVTSRAWGRIIAPELPADVTLAALTVIEAGGVPIGEYTMHMSMLGPSGDRAGSSSFPVTVAATGQVVRLSKYVPLGVRLQTAGIHQVVVSTDMGDLLSVPIAVETG